MEETKSIASQEVLMEQWNCHNWDELWKKLMARAVYIFRYRYRVSWSNEELKAYCRQMISETLDKIFIEQARNWNMVSYPNFEDFLFSALDSHINNFFNKKSMVLIGEEEAMAKKENGLTPEEKLSWQGLRKDIYEALEQQRASDEELLVYECIADGICKPQEIRKELGMGEVEFHNVWRKLKRKRDIIKQKITGHGN